MVIASVHAHAVQFGAVPDVQRAVDSLRKSWPSPPSSVEFNQYPFGSPLQRASEPAVPTQLPWPWMNTTVPLLPPHTRSNFVGLAEALFAARPTPNPTATATSATRLFIAATSEPSLSAIAKPEKKAYFLRGFREARPDSEPLLRSGFERGSEI